MKSNLEVFIDLSVVLTGISKEILAPAVTNFDLAEHYFKESKNKFGKCFDNLIEEFRDIKDPNDIKVILDHILLGLMARQITFLWYMGAWAVETSFGVQTRIIDSISYQKGMVWQVMQSHAMGYSLSRYGHWAVEPGDLKAYIGDENNSTKGWN